MTKEEKQLLLIDLCARLPYGVIVDNPNPADGAWDEVINIDTSTKTVTLLYDGRIFSVEDIRPYLRPLLSMTEEEQKVVNRLIYNKEGIIRTSSTPVWVINESNIEEYVDFCNSHHLDWRGLIPIGLALEAPKDMYKTE